MAVLREDLGDGVLFLAGTGVRSLSYFFVSTSMHTKTNPTTNRVGLYNFSVYRMATTKEVRVWCTRGRSAILNSTKKKKRGKKRYSKD